MRQDIKTNNFIKELVILSDFLVLNILFYVYLSLDSYYGLHFTNGADVFMLVLIMNMAMVVAQYFYSTVIHERRSTPEQVLRQVTFLVLMQGIMAYLIIEFSFIYKGLVLPSIKFTAYFTIVLYVSMLASRYLERWLVMRYRHMGRNTRKVVFVGSDSSIKPVYDYLVQDPSTGYRVLGYYADNIVEECPEGLLFKGTLADLEKKITADNIPGAADELYCSLPVSESDRIRQIMRYCNNNVVHFYYIPTVSFVFGPALKSERIGDTTVFTNYSEPLEIPANKMVKRTFDVCASLFVLICLLPFIPIIALIIKIQSPGPLFFKQVRTGLSGKEFYCYKFRSMHVNKDADLVQATEHDPRKFAFGNFMRKANIDELPQFFNVLNGNMSIVGPRPHMLKHTEVYRQLIDKYMVRHFVKPGITGWAQVTGFRGETKELWQMKGRVKRDIWYIEHWSIWLDIRIMWKTAVQIFVHDKNAY